MKESNTSTTAAETQLVLKGAHCLRIGQKLGRVGQSWKDMINVGTMTRYDKTKLMWIS